MEEKKGKLSRISSQVSRDSFRQRCRRDYCPQSRTDASLKPLLKGSLWNHSQDYHKNPGSSFLSSFHSSEFFFFFSFLSFFRFSFHSSFLSYASHLKESWTWSKRFIAFHLRSPKCACTPKLSGKFGSPHPVPFFLHGNLLRIIKNPHESPRIIKKIPKNPQESSKNPQKSSRIIKKIPKNPQESSNIPKNPQESSNIPKNPQESSRILKHLEASWSILKHLEASWRNKAKSKKDLKMGNPETGESCQSARRNGTHR